MPFALFFGLRRVEWRLRQQALIVAGSGRYSFLRNRYAGRAIEVGNSGSAAADAHWFIEPCLACDEYGSRQVAWHHEFAVARLNFAVTVQHLN